MAIPAPYEGPDRIHNKSCPHCRYPLRIKLGKNGGFISCSTWPRCTYSENVTRGSALSNCTNCGAAAGEHHEIACARRFEGDSPHWTHDCPECGERGMRNDEPWKHTKKCSQFNLRHQDQLEELLKELEQRRDAARERDNKRQQPVEEPKAPEETDMDEDRAEQGEGAMEEDDEMEDKDIGIRTTGEMLSEHLVRGGKVALADEAGEITQEVAQSMLGELYPEVFKTPNGRAFAKLVAAGMLHYGAEKFPDMVPGAEHIQAACGYVVEAQARDLVQPRLTQMRPALARLATVGKSIAKGQVRVDTQSLSSESEVEEVPLNGQGKKKKDKAARA